MLIASSSGRDIDAEKSLNLQKLGKLPQIRNIIIIDDEPQDARHITAVLNLLLGRETQLRHFKSISQANQGLYKQAADLVVLDDHLPPLDRAESSIRSLRRHGITAPIIIVSGQLTRARRIELAALEPLAILEKDDINTFTFAEVLGRLAAKGA